MLVSNLESLERESWWVIKNGAKTEWNNPLVQWTKMGIFLHNRRHAPTYQKGARELPTNIPTPPKSTISSTIRFYPSHCSKTCSNLAPSFKQSQTHRGTYHTDKNNLSPYVLFLWFLKHSSFVFINRSVIKSWFSSPSQYQLLNINILSNFFSIFSLSLSLSLCLFVSVRI